MLIAFMLVLVSTPAHAERGCIINIAGIKVCGEILGQPLPPVATVTVRPPPLPPVTVTPRPRATVTEKVTVPGPTKTVTAHPRANDQSRVAPPAPTKTVTVSPPAPTRTALPEPVSTVTETVRPSPTGQTPTATVTIEPKPRDNASGDLDFSDGRVTLVEAGIGLITILALVGLLLLALYAGYVLGYKDKERRETDFLRAVLDSAKIRRR